MSEKDPTEKQPIDIFKFQLDQAAEAQSDAELVYEMLDVLIAELNERYEIEMSKPEGARDLHHLADLAKKLSDKFLQQDELEKAFDANDAKINKVMDRRDSFEKK